MIVMSKRFLGITQTLWQAILQIQILEYRKFSTNGEIEMRYFQIWKKMKN